MIRRLFRGWSRLALIDVPSQFSPSVPVIATQAAFALLCTCLTLVIRAATDLFLPGAGPFALTVPATLVATLFGRWQCGLICLTLSCAHAWYFVLPAKASFSFVDPADGPRVAVNVVSGFFVVALAEIFRRTMRRALEERELLLAEIEHRVKNNFASVAALLRIQQNRAEDEQVRNALQSAIGRIESFAHANSMLYRNFEKIDAVNIGRYLPDLCSSLERSLGMANEIRISCRADNVELPRDRAVSIALLVNEAATNAAKHAFGEKPGGRIDIDFRRNDAGYRLDIADNGKGMTKHSRKSSMGMSLIEALTQQAGGTFEVETSADGTKFSFAFEL